MLSKQCIALFRVVKKCVTLVVGRFAWMRVCEGCQRWRHGGEAIAAAAGGCASWLAGRSQCNYSATQGRPVGTMNHRSLDLGLPRIPEAFPRLFALRAVCDELFAGLHLQESRKSGEREGPSVSCEWFGGGGGSYSIDHPSPKKTLTDRVAFAAI